MRTRIQTTPKSQAKSREKKSDYEWLTLAQAAGVLCVSRATFDSAYRPLTPAADIRGAGAKGVKIRFRGLFDAVIADRVAKATPKVDDPMLVGGDSPALEEYRKHRARIAKVEAEERERTHVDLREIDDAMTRFAGIVRGAGEALQRQFGNGASDILNEAIDEAERQFNEQK